MDTKKIYESPEMEIITFEVEDVITNSIDNETPVVPGQGMAMLDEDDDFIMHA